MTDILVFVVLVVLLAVCVYFGFDILRQLRKTNATPYYVGSSTTFHGGLSDFEKSTYLKFSAQKGIVAADIDHIKQTFIGADGQLLEKEYKEYIKKLIGKEPGTVHFVSKEDMPW